MPEFFHDAKSKDAHDKLQKWREANARGFVINRKTTAVGMIHRSDCQHMGDFFWKPNGTAGLTKSEKVCSCDRDELSHWAEAHQVKLAICNDCMGK